MKNMFTKLTKKHLLKKVIYKLKQTSEVRKLNKRALLILIAYLTCIFGLIFVIFCEPTIVVENKQEIIIEQEQVVEQELTPPQVVERPKQEQKIPIETNVVCELGKNLTYTNIDNISLKNFNLNAWYVDNQGYVRENETNAIYVAMGTNYQKNNYYTITTSDNQSFKVKVVDIKSDNHTTNSCYTTHDNSIVELWLTNKNNDFKNLGNSRVVGVSVVEIKE